MSEVSFSPSEATWALYRFAADCMKWGMTPEIVARELTQKGVSPAAARLMVQNLSAARKRVNSRVILRRVGINALICAFGVVIMLGAAAGAAASGSLALVAGGAILFGGLRCILALAEL
jgi:hypothetical protein